MFSYVIIAVWLSRGEKGMMKIEKKNRKNNRTNREKSKEQSHTANSTNKQQTFSISRARAYSEKHQTSWRLLFY